MSPPKKFSGKENSVAVLEKAHMISIMIYLLENEGCRKMELYQEVSNNPRMPDKLRELQEHGLIEQVQEGKSTKINLTECGRNVASTLSMLNDIVEKCKND